MIVDDEHRFSAPDSFAEKAGEIYLYRAEGNCPICEAETIFSTRHEWFRDYLICERCRSIPRERNLFLVLMDHFPNWRDLSIHESSPVPRGVSVRLKNECARYVATQYDLAIPFGMLHPAGTYRSEDLENQSFADECFDIVVTQDVMEHLFDPVRATREIARTLRPGGAHVFSVPIVRKRESSRRRARMGDNGIEHLLPEQYHDNPISEKGSLVTVDWGYDILGHLARGGLAHSMHYIDDLSKGIRAEYIEVVVGWKFAPGATI